MGQGNWTERSSCILLREERHVRQCTESCLRGTPRSRAGHACIDCPQNSKAEVDRRTYAPVSPVSVVCSPD